MKGIVSTSRTCGARVFVLETDLRSRHLPRSERGRHGPVHAAPGPDGITGSNAPPAWQTQSHQNVPTCRSQNIPWLVTVSTGGMLRAANLTVSTAAWSAVNGAGTGTGTQGAGSGGQIVSQCRRITTPGDVSPLWAHAERIAGNVIDVNSPTGGATIISAVSRNDNANRLSWQIRTGNVSQTSSVGATQGGAATISNGFVVPAGQTLFVTEVYAVVRPWVLSAGLIGTALPSVINGTTLFLSRAPDPVALQAQAAAGNVPDGTA